MKLLSNINDGVLDIRNDLQTGFGSVNKNIANMRKEIRGDLRIGFSGVNKNIDGMRKDMKTGFGSVNKNIANMKRDTSQIPALRNDINSGSRAHRNC